MSHPAATLVPPRVDEASEARPSSSKPRPAPAWNVVLLDDDDHTYEYVIGMMRRLFGHSDHAAYKIACDVDVHGRAICFTTHKELAELKRDQISAFGADRLIMHCSGSMSALIEPATGGGGEES